MKNYKSLVTGSLIAAMVIMAPIATFAEGNNKNEKGNNNIRSEQNKNENENNDKSYKGNSFFTGAMNWFKDHKNNNWKNKIKNTVLPIISNVNITSVKSNKATINWNTDTKSNTMVWFSKTSPVDTSVKPNNYNSRKALVLNHKIEMKNLEANTKYYVIVGSTNDIGITKSTETSFTTPAITPIIIDTTAPIISGITTNVNGVNATISWKTNELSTSNVFYSTTTPIDVNAVGTLKVMDSSLQIDHSINIPNLTSSTLYHFIIKSLDSSNNAVFSSEATFATN